VKAVMHQSSVKLGAHSRNEAVYAAMKLGEINLNELLSLEELAEILSSLDPGVLRTIVDLVRQNLVKKAPPQDGEAIRTDARRRGVLTNRERDVLILASHGFTNLEIAERLCMSTSAVRTFLNRAFNKLGVCRRADAVELALKRKEISVGEISTLDELTYFLATLGAESIEKMAQIIDRNIES
jgi:ATP/maltotriose-dependent transcriptional regulator MalT